MKNNIPLWLLSIAASLILSTGLLAQEKTELTVKIEKDGKVVTDTTYLFDDMDEARHALEMMDLISSDDEHKEHVHYNITSAHSGSNEAKKMVFISEDGETTEITEFSGDSNVWVSEEDDGHGKKVIVMKSEEDNWTVVEGDDDVKVKVMKVIEEEGDGENVKVIVIKKSGDVDCDHDEDHDCDHDEDVEVKVVKKKVKKEKE